MLPGVPAFQNFSFSEFQIFTHPGMHDLDAGEGRILNGGRRAKLPFQITESRADAVFMIGGSRPENDIPRK